MHFEHLNRTQRQIMMITSKFGYINKKTYLDYMDGTSKAYKFKTWSELQRHQFISPYNRECFNKSYFYLNSAGLRLMRQAGFDPVTKVNPIYFEHDDVVMRFVLAFEASGAIRSDWLNEGVVKKYSNSQIYDIFNSSLSKLPDLIFDLNMKNRPIKIALEVERSSKNQARYDVLISGYSKAKSIDMVLIAHASNYVKESILLSARKLGYPRAQRPIGFIDYKELAKNPSTAVLSIEGKKIRLADYFKNIQRLVDKKGKDHVDIESPVESTEI